MSRYNYSHRRSREVKAGRCRIGGSNPVRIQSMTNTSTLDTERSALQAARIAEAGGELVRLTTQGVREASNMAAIKARLREIGCDVPLVADVHFNPKAAYEAAIHCDKVRINPGNFVDAARTFVRLEYTDEEYRAELERIRAALLPFLALCREHSTAIRLGVNHGSLSDRIMSRYGNNAPGMVESAMEYLRVCREAGFDDVVISIKASNTVVMTETVRLLAQEMEREGMDYPLHLGVTEAGDGEDGRVKSAVGIGTLLAEGLGDTIRVSLSEDPEKEIPVAAMLRDYIAARAGHKQITEPDTTPEGRARDFSTLLPGQRDTSDVLIAGTDFELPENALFIEASASPEELKESLVADSARPVVVTSGHINPVGEIAAFIDRARLLGLPNPFVLRLTYDTCSADELQVRAGADYGFLLLNGYGSAIMPEAPAFSADYMRHLALGLLQATRLRFSRPEYIACPGCGRTLFDLQSTLQEVKRATASLRGLKIGVMGCIVNGPGEMADADYGYVGAGPGRVSLYRNKELIVKNIPSEEALPRLIALIKADGRWTDD